MDRRIPNDTLTAIGFVATGFELRFYQSNEKASGPQQGRGGREDEFEGDEGTIGDDQIEWGGLGSEGIEGEMTGVGLLHHHHAGVLAKFPGELAVSDVDGGDGGRAVLEEAIGEPAGAGAEIEGADALDGECEVGEGVFQFVAAAAHVAIIGD